MEGNPSPSSLRRLTREAYKALHTVNNQLASLHLSRWDPDKDIIAVILDTSPIATGLLFQEPSNPLEWVHLSTAFPSKISPKLDMFCMMISQLFTRTLQLFGLDPDKLVFPLTKQEISLHLKNNILLQGAVMAFPGKLDNHLPHWKPIQALIGKTVHFSKIIW